MHAEFLGSWDRKLNGWLPFEVGDASNLLNLEPSDLHELPFYTEVLTAYFQLDNGVSSVLQLHSG